jgi:hypothetical protein
VASESVTEGVESAVVLLEHTLVITGFVFVMMLVIEYLNVLTSGAWASLVAKSRWRGVVLAAFLGATPGCLGVFAVVAMYSHRVVTVGAVVAAMVATSGDAAFLMFAEMPRQALLVTVILFGLGLLTGVVVDVVLSDRRSRRALLCEGLVIHEEEHCECFPRRRIFQQLRECSAARGVLLVGLAGFLAGVVTGRIGPEQWNWIRVILAASSGMALFITATVPDHFLEEHLWGHVAKGHAPRIFLWTLGALTVTHVLTHGLNVREFAAHGRWAILVAACLVGIIPDSGPNYVFVLLVKEGAVSFSVLLANSIVQDGHGMLPLLAHTRRGFVAVKAVNLAVGLVVGLAAMAAGY